MKTLFLSIVCLALGLVSFSQTPQSFSYQAVVRDAGGVILANQNVNLKILILDNSPNGTVLFSETHNVITNEFGLINLQIGSGLQLTGTFASISWGVNNKYIRMEIDPTGGTNFNFLGTSQLLSVPYALYSASSGNGGANYSAGNGMSISGNVISNTAPDQVISITGAGSTSVSGTYPNFIISSADNVNDADSNPTNELQSLSQSGTNITLSNGGGSFSINDGDTTLWKKNGNNIYRRYFNVGIGTNNPQYRLHLNDTLNNSKLNSVYLNSIGGNTLNTWYTGIYSRITGTNGAQFGISGYSEGANLQENYGVYGRSTNGFSNYGVVGDAVQNANTNVGVYGLASGNGDGQLTSRNYGVIGMSGGNFEGSNFGLWGQVQGVSKQDNVGVLGYNNATGSGSNAKNYGALMFSVGSSTISSNYGIYTEASQNSSPLNYGIYSFVTPGTNSFSGYFVGNVQINGNLNVTGNISKGGGTFKIDHPTDPYNKYLVHSFVESPEMINIYNGIISTDSNGIAIVYLPEYFQSANKDFKYQLTTIGKFAQAIIFEEIKGNFFVIKTSEPNTKVSWEVTGVRADKYAENNRVIPEQEKELKGTLIHPELYEQEESVSEQYQHLKKQPPILNPLKGRF